MMTLQMQRAMARFLILEQLLLVPREVVIRVHCNEVNAFCYAHTRLVIAVVSAI